MIFYFLLIIEVYIYDSFEYFFNIKIETEKYIFHIIIIKKNLRNVC